MIAAANNHVDTVSLLVSAATSDAEREKLVSALDENNRTALHLAAKLGSLESCKVLVSNGCPLSVLDAYGKTARDYFSRVGTSAEWDQSVASLRPVSLLFSSVQGKDLPLLEAQLAKGADVNQPDENGMTPLHWAAYLGWLPGVKALCDVKGIDLNRGYCNGHTPLHLACSVGSSAVVSRLLSRGANATLATKEGKTPLHVAAATPVNTAEVNAIIADLVKAGADKKAKDKEGKTPKDTAAPARDSAALILLSV